MLSGRFVGGRMDIVRALVDRIAGVGQRQRFYRDAVVDRTEWWYGWGSEYPDTYFARLRIFNTGRADVLFEGQQTIYGFENETYAGYFISEDEFSRLHDLDEGDRLELQIPAGVEIHPPNWPDRHEYIFKYIGKY